MKKPFSQIENKLVTGDPMLPNENDLIAQIATVKTSTVLPFGWLVLTGNPQTSMIGRIAFRHEIENEMAAQGER